METPFSRSRRAALLGTAATLAILAASPAQAATFTNSTPIVIPTSVTNASPYPSAIAVSGLGGATTSVSVTLNGFSHSFISDVGIVLVAPNGDALDIQGRAGAGGGLTNLTYTLADAGTSQLPQDGAWTAGTYKPTSYSAGFSYPAPGPETSYANPGPTGGGTATFASIFNGDSPNGTWKLFVRDFNTLDSGQIAGGWTLDITAPDTTTPPAPPDTQITKAKISQRKRKARFTFTSSGAASGFECALAKRGRTPKFKGCSSPKTYRGLKPARYRFSVRAVGPGGTDAAPATKKFRIKP